MGVTTALVAVSAYQVNRQERFQERQEEIQQASAATQRFTQRRRQIREQRIRRAQIQQAAVSTGVADSSGVAGVEAGLATSFAVGEGRLRGEERLSGMSAQAAEGFSRSMTIATLAKTGIQAFDIARRLPDVPAEENIFEDDTNLF
jgi:hypothetical protein